MTGERDKAPGPTPAASDDASWGETIKIVVHALLLAFVVRAFLYQPFNIPSGSMKPTLLVGDYLFVSKLSYGYSRYSFYFGLPVFQGRWFGSAPKRGDVAVFKLPSDNSTDYIKRVIGLPGDKIAVRKGVVSINGTVVPRKPTGTFVDEDFNRYRPSRSTLQAFEETLPNGVKYTVLDSGENGDSDNFPRDGGAYTVPANHYFMMGDNRDNSDDSRANVGPVPYENFVGRADVIFYSSDPGCSFSPDSAWVVQQLKVFGCASSVGVRVRRFFNLVR
jgi:signal peptidase I